MADTLTIPIEVEADGAADAIDAIVESFGRLEEKVQQTAEESETTRAAFAKLKEQFAAGAISADAYRDALTKIATAAESVDTSVRTSASGSSRLREALREVRGEALSELSQKAAELAGQLPGIAGDIAEVGVKSLAAFGPVGIVLTGVAAALAFATQAYKEHRAQVELLEAQSQNLIAVEQQLGAAYPSVAAAIEGATTAAEAHTRAIAEQQRVLGQQIDLMNAAFSAEEARRYTLQLQQTAGAVRELGNYLHGATEEQIRAAIETGNATTQQTLLGVSFVHSADAVQEHTNRVNAAIVVEQRAAEAVAQHKDELVRIAQANLEAARDEMQAAAAVDGNGTERAAAARRVAEATDALTEAQNRAAVAHRNAAAGAQESARALDELESASEAARAAADEQALQRGYAAIRRMAEARRRRNAAGSRGQSQQDSKSEKADDLAFERQIAAAYESERQAVARLREELGREAEARDAARRAALDHLTERQRAEEERVKTRTLSQSEREKAESVEGAAAAREAERLHREQQHRLAMTQTYTERMRDLHGEEVDSTRALAEGVSAAFTEMGAAFSEHLQAFVAGRETLSAALQGMLSDTLMAISKQAAAKGAMEIAEGLAAIAGVVTAGLAPGHFAAAGAYFGVAALAGLGGAATAPSTASPGAAASRGAGGRESAARLPGVRESAPVGATYNVTFGGPMYGTGGVRQAAREFAGVMNRGAVQGGVQLLPGALLGGGAGA